MIEARWWTMCCSILSRLTSERGFLEKEEGKFKHSEEKQYLCSRIYLCRFQDWIKNLVGHLPIELSLGLESCFLIFKKLFLQHLCLCFRAGQNILTMLTTLLEHVKLKLKNYRKEASQSSSKVFLFLSFLYEIWIFVDKGAYKNVG